MKKIILLFFILSSLSFSSQKYNFKFDEVDLLNIEVSKKYNENRCFEGSLKNKTDQKILVLNFEIKYRDENSKKNDLYYTVGKIALYNIEPKETINFIEYVDVYNLDGLDFRIELYDIII